MNNNHTNPSPRTLLSEGRLLEASTGIRDRLRLLGHRKQADVLSGKIKGYCFMLKYASTGASDPGRDLMISDFKADCRGYLDHAEAIDLNKNSQVTYFSLLRLDRLQNVALTSLLEEYSVVLSDLALAGEAGADTKELYRQKDDVLRRIFDKVLVLPFMASADLKLLVEKCVSKDATWELKAQIAGALFLSFCYLYDRHKLFALLDMLDAADDDRLSARLSIYIFLILSMYKEEVESDLTAVGKLEEWSSSLINYTNIRDVIQQFLIEMDTSRINRKMQTEIIPGLKSISPEIMKTLRKNYTKEELEDLAMNPQWEEMLRESGVEEKMRELSELQSEGADVMMMPLSNLKNHRFFNRASNWFLPFDKKHSDLAAISSSGFDGLDMVLGMNKELCDTDRYSLVLSLTQMPAQAAKMMFSQLNAGLEQMNSDLKDRLLKVENPSFRMEAVRHMRDLYRFFNLYRDKKELTNPFELPDAFLKVNVFRAWTAESEVSNLLCDFYFKRGYYECALPLLQEQALSSQVDARVWEKIGFCHQSLGNPAEAIDAYKRAEILSTDNEWLYGMMALCYKALKDFKYSEIYYAKVLELDPDNTRKLHREIVALIRRGKYDEALHLSHKLDYLEGNSRRNIGLLLLSAALAGNAEEMEKQKLKLMLLSSGGGDADSNLILAAVALLNSQFRDAVDFLKLYEPNPAKCESKAKAQLESLNISSKLDQKLTLALELLRLDNRPDYAQ